MIEKSEFLEKYGDVKVKFDSYYKYSFGFKAILSNGDVLTVEVGGHSDYIYRMEVVADLEETITSLDPYSGQVWTEVDGVKTSYDSFYDD